MKFMSNVRDILEYLMPFIATAGAYSAAVQNRITSHESKDGPTAFHHALSDADLTVQGYVEVALLARYPEVSFFSEEREQSLNAKYFPHSAELEVMLDPIDGTRAYIAQRNHYQIIVAVHDTREIVGALCFMPRLARCYVATRGDGAFVKTHEECRAGAPGARLDVTKSKGPVLVFNRPDLVERLKDSFDVRDLVHEFDAGIAAHHSTDLLEGRAASVISAPAQAIDAGALACIAKEAGAVVTDERGVALASFRGSQARTLPYLIASANPDVHAEVLRVLQGK